MTPAAVEHLIAGYGSLVTEVLDLIRADKTLGRPLLDGYPYLCAEVAYAVTHEGALHAEDVLARRVRLLIESADAGASAAPQVITIMAGLLGWNRRRRAPNSAATGTSPPPTPPRSALRPSFLSHRRRCPFPHRPQREGPRQSLARHSPWRACGPAVPQRRV